jgi:hypothetical protein
MPLVGAFSHENGKSQKRKEIIFLRGFLFVCTVATYRHAFFTWRFAKTSEDA